MEREEKKISKAEALRILRVAQPLSEDLRMQCEMVLSRRE
jgi:hypothetical protein